MQPYERFQAWQVCHELALAVYHSTRDWPREEIYGMSSQIRRAAISAASNIAEGSAKRGGREFRRFLDMSLGSLAELSYLRRLASDLDLLTTDRAEAIKNLHERASRLTWGLYQSISRGRGPADPP